MKTEMGTEDQPEKRKEKWVTLIESESEYFGNGGVKDWIELEGLTLLQVFVKKASKAQQIDRFLQLSNRYFLLLLLQLLFVDIKLYPFFFLFHR